LALLINAFIFYLISFIFFLPKYCIIRRYYRSKENFWTEFKEICDKWYLLYNSEEGFMRVAIGERNEFEIENPLLFELFKTNMK